GIFLDSPDVGLHGLRVDAAVELSATRKMTERVDVRADVAAERHGVSGGTHAPRRHEIAMFLGQAVEKRRVRRKMRHPGEIRLAEVVDARTREEGEEIFHGMTAETPAPFP